jgi:hypothetical protein
MAKIDARKLLFLFAATVAIVLGAGRIWWAQTPPANQSQSNKRATNSELRNKPSPQPTSDVSQRLESLISLSRSAAPEVEADLLFTTLSANLVSDKRRQLELLDEAFQTAFRVKEPIRKRSWSPLVDTRSGYKQRAFDLRLDRLSIQSQAILKTIPLDPLRARVMFQGIVLPKLEPLDCKDSLVADFGAYYEMVVLLAEHSFTPDEIKAQSHIQLITDQLEAIKSVSQATAALKALVGVKLSDEELSRVVVSLAKAFAQASADPRAFAFAVQRDGFITVGENFIASLKRRGIPTDEFSVRIHDFLIKNMSGEVCADASWIKERRVIMPRELETINAHFKSPITTDDLSPTRVGDKSADAEYWMTPKAKGLLQMAKELRFAPDGRRLSPDERTSEDWHRKLLAFLDQLDGWDATTELSEDDYFQQRCNMYRVLVDLCPDDLQRDAVLRAYGNYLKETNVTYKGRIEWISPVKDYLRILQTKNQKMVKSSLEPWLSSSDNTLRIYAELAMLTLKPVTS